MDGAWAKARSCLPGSTDDGQILVLTIMTPQGRLKQNEKMTKRDNMTQNVLSTIQRKSNKRLSSAITHSLRLVRPSIAARGSGEIPPPPPL